MAKLLSRRQYLLGLASMLTGCKYKDLEPTFGALFRAGDMGVHYMQSALLANQRLAKEYSLAEISAVFPTVGTVAPTDETYIAHREKQFVDWKLPVTGLVENPRSFSLAELKAYPSRTQITSHICQEGWSAIGEWTGVQLGRLLEEVRLQPEARYVFFFATDGWYNSVDLYDAFHPQTLLAYGMNGGELPQAHGAPVRLRVERQLGYKSIKFVERIEVVDSIKKVGNGLGSSGASYGYSWNAGI